MPELAWLNWLASTGHLADIAIASLLVEALVALRLSKRTTRATIIFNVLSGIALMLALRTALTDGSATLIALFMSLGFVAHMGELAARKKR